MYTDVYNGAIRSRGRCRTWPGDATECHETLPRNRFGGRPGEVPVPRRAGADTRESRATAREFMPSVERTVVDVNPATTSMVPTASPTPMPRMRFREDRSRVADSEAFSRGTPPGTESYVCFAMAKGGVDRRRRDARTTRESVHARGGARGSGERRVPCVTECNVTAIDRAEGVQSRFNRARTNV